MFRVYGAGYAGTGPLPVAIDYTVQARTCGEALDKVRRLGVIIIHCTVIRTH
jgi:hypothetical protein